MNILLVYPRHPNTFWSFRQALKFISKKAAMPPLGLLTIASMLPKKWDKRLVDLNVTELSNNDLKWSDMVFISGMMVQKNSILNIISRAKQFNRTIVAGGPAFTSQYTKFKGVDHFVLNEAEITLPMFLYDLKRGKPKHIYLSDKRPDITKTPAPDWGLINLKNYASMAIQYSRGCPYNCEFCDIVIMNGRIPRTKTPSQIMEELDTLYSVGWRGELFIVDDNFIGNKQKVKEMLPHLIDWQKKHKFPFRLMTEATTNLANDTELMQLMVAANFYKVFLGIETTNIESLKECNKYHNVSLDLAESVRMIHNYGMQVMAGFIVGFDNDTEKVFDSQIRFIQEVGIVTAMVGLLNAAPQTRLWHRLKAEGRLLGETTGENTDGTINFIPKMDTQKLMAGYKKILTTIYSQKQYYRRIYIFIKSYRPVVKTRIAGHDIEALLKSMWKIGILSKARFRYWWLIIRTFFTKMKSVPIAIELAIYGQHFERVTKRILNV